MGLPSISVEFKKMASTARRRSARGVVAVIVNDDTSKWDVKHYAKLSDVVPSEFTSENYKAIARTFDASPHKVSVVRIGVSGGISDATKILDTITYNWVCAINTSLQSGLVSYVKGVNTPGRVVAAKCVATGAESADDMHIVNVANTTVKIKGEEENTNINLYLPRIAGVLAAQPMTGSVTYKAMEDLEDIAVISDADASVENGNFIFIKDDDVVRIASGVNTLQTITGDKTEDEKKIAIVEAMDIIKEDMIRIFKNEYLAKVKNSASNQALLVSSYFNYLKELANEDIIDGEQPITMTIDVDAMRKAWASAGVDLSGMEDAKVKKKTFRSSVFVTGSCHILDAMENITVAVTLA